MSSLSELITNAWYQNKKWIFILYPLMVLFWVISVLRRRFYIIGWFKSTKIPIPVVVVGNISVGGTGKSPLTAYLVGELKKRGFTPGVISRGYGGHSQHYPLLVSENSSPCEVGDEPVMLYQISKCPIAVDPIRSRAALFLYKEHKCNVIICDDGLQHYALDRDIEICVIDSKRGLGNGFLLPVGPLRESGQRLNDVDFVIANGDSTLVLPLVDKSRSDFMFDMALQASDLINVFDGRTWSVSELNSKKVHAVAGIGNPERFFNALKALGVDPTCHGYPDHHTFSREDISFEDDFPVVMTHKDAVKCRVLYEGVTLEEGGQPKQMWYLPVNAVINEQFIHALSTRLYEL